jgi:hypothetical protein
MNDRRAFISINGPAMFWIFCIIAVVCATYVWLKKPPQLGNPLKYTEQERMLRAMRDPLALRLYALSHLKLYNDDNRMKAIQDVTQQWEKEVQALSEHAYVRTGWGGEKASWEAEQPADTGKVKELEKRLDNLQKPSEVELTY